MSHKNGIEYFIVERGHDSDPDLEETGRVGVRRMGDHGKSVKTEHLPFNQTLKSGGNHFHRPPAPGTILAGYVPRGAEHTGYAHLLGAFSTKQESGVSAPGNEILPFLDKAQNIELKIKLPPNVKAILEANRTGLQKFKKEIEEKGEKFKQATLRGLASDGAIFALSGIRNTPIKNISTAIDKVVDQMSSSKLAQLPAGLGSLDLNSIINQLISSLTDIEPKLKETLESFVKTAMGDLNSVSPPGASLGNIVNQAAFLTKALDLMKDAKTSGDVIRAIQKLQHPDLLADTLSGIDAIKFDVDSIYGKISQTLNASGELSNVANSFIDNIKKALKGLLDAIPGTGSSGESFFTGDGTPIPDLIERLKDTAGATALKEAVEKVSSTNNSKKAKQRTNNNGAGKGATQDIIFSAMQLVARDGRIIPFLPTDSTGQSSGQLPAISTPEPNPSVADDDPMLVYSAFESANVAFIHANSAFNAANAALSSANIIPAFDQANTARNNANTAYLTGVGAFAATNAETVRVTSTFDSLNAEIIRGTSTYATVNAETIRLTAAYAQANTARNSANTAYNSAVGAFAAGNAETIRLTSTFAALNAETTRGTSTYATLNTAVTELAEVHARANGTWADSGYSTPVVNAAVGIINTYTANMEFKRIDRDTGHFNLLIVMTDKGNAATRLIVKTPFFNGGHFTVVPGRHGGGLGTNLMLQGYMSEDSNTLSIVNYDNTFPNANGRLTISGVVKTQTYTG